MIKSRKKRNSIISVLFALMAVSLLMWNFQIRHVSAATSEFENNGEFYAVTGASVKIYSPEYGNDEKDYNGIRFSFEMSVAKYEALTEGEDVKTFKNGVTVIARMIPVALLNGETTHENIIANEKTLQKEIPADKWVLGTSAVDGNDKQVYTSYAYLYNIPGEQAYIKDIACFAQLSSEGSVLNTNVQVRSMRQVAMNAVDADNSYVTSLERYLPSNSVVFKAFGESVGNQNVKYGATIDTESITIPSEDGYVFTGWLDANGDSFDFTTPIKNSVEITAKWHAKQYGKIDFSNYESLEQAQNQGMGMWYDSGAVDRTTERLIVTDDGYTAISATPKTTGWPTFIVNGSANVLGNFDYITARIKWGGNINDLTVYMNANAGTAAITATQQQDGDWVLATIRKTASNAASFEAMKTNGFKVYLGKSGITSDYVVAEIFGGYDSFMAESNGTNLAEKFGVNSNELNVTFTPKGGESEAVSSVTAFTTEVDGKLTVTINKQGYAPTVFEVDVTAPKSYGKFDFKSYSDTEELSKIASATRGTNLALTLDNEEGYPVAKATGTGSYLGLKITDSSIKNLAKFDYITVRMKITNSTGSCIVGIQGTNNTNIYNIPEGFSTDIRSLKKDGNWIVATWRKDRVNSGGTPTGKYVFDYIAQNGVIEFIINAFGGAATTSNIIVAEVVGGYDDIVISEDAIDLTTKFGLSADEMSAVFVNSEGVSETVDNLTSFVPSKAGVLQVTVIKSGYASTVISVNVN